MWTEVLLWFMLYGSFHSYPCFRAVCSNHFALIVRKPWLEQEQGWKIPGYISTISPPAPVGLNPTLISAKPGHGLRNISQLQAYMNLIPIVQSFIGLKRFCHLWVKASEVTVHNNF